MTIVGLAHMNHQAIQFILEVAFWVLGVTLLLTVLGFLQRLGGELLQAHFHRELAFVIDLGLRHHVKIKVKSLQDQNQMIGKLLDAHPLDRGDLLLAELAEVGIVVLQ